MAELVFYSGPMGSSKTAHALMTNFQYNERGKKVWLIKPAIDTREEMQYDNGRVIKTLVRSRIGISAWADAIHDTDKLLPPEQTEVIICDEAQFLTVAQVEELKMLADKDDTDTLIFDEIDTGVSGRAAGKIAKKLYDVSTNRQVVCITHLPTIAAFADQHMLISKAVKDEKTYTSVLPLDKNGRIAEIARIIGGNENDKAHLESAKKLLDEADGYKRGVI